MAASSKREQTHQRIVDAAARALRREGFAGVGVADVMKQAGLTHGGFYAHFDSRDTLLQEALEKAATDSAAALAERVSQLVSQGMSPLRALIETYLSDEHCAATDQGCVVGALGSEMVRQSEPLLALSRSRAERLVGQVAAALPAGAPAEQAAAIAGALVGALQLARVLGSDDAGRKLIADARKALISQYAQQ
jgi:AcrR family transcriptional regulator